MGADQGLTHLYYDGGCGFCSGGARFVARRDRSGGIRFAPLGGEMFQQWIPPAQRSGLPDSLLVRTPQGELLNRSGAVIHLLERMGLPWHLLGTVLVWVPVRMRDAAYDLVARRRKAWRACPKPPVPGDERFVP